MEKVVGILLICLYGVVASTQPNIIFIMVDDMGWNDIGYHASDQLKTPNLDKLAAEGVKLNKYYTTPLCTPSRAALLTGRDPIHTGMQTFVILPGEPWGLGLNETLLPQKLKEQGYSTHLIGKWHLGYHQKEYTPLYRGFDTFYGYYQAQTDFFDHTNKFGTVGLDLHDNLEPDWSVNGTYNTDLYTKKAEELIISHSYEKPLFLYLAHSAGHVGWRWDHPPLNDGIDVPQEWVDKFSNIPHIGRRRYVAMLANLDYNIGKLYNTMEKRGILENTVIVVASDNGAQANGFLANWGSSYPLRGGKMTVFEGGVRVPSFVNSKLLKKRNASYNQLFHVTDWFPTLLKLAGGNVDDKIDGYDQWGAINDINPPPRSEVLVNIDDTLLKQRALIYNKWKIMKQGKLKLGKKPATDLDGWCKPPTEASDTPLADNMHPPCFTQNLTSSHCTEEYCLFNLEDDPIERHDVSIKYPAILAMMKTRLEKYVKSKVKSRRNKFKDPRADPKYHNHSFEPWIESH